MIVMVMMVVVLLLMMVKVTIEKTISNMSASLAHLSQLTIPTKLPEGSHGNTLK